MEGSNIRDVFGKLGKRLYYFESENYLFGSKFPEPYESLDEDFDYETLMDWIGQKVNSFDPKDVCAEAMFYEQRILNVIGNLKPRTKNLS